MPPFPLTAPLLFTDGMTNIITRCARGSPIFRGARNRTRQGRRTLCPTELAQHRRSVQIESFIRQPAARRYGRTHWGLQPWRPVLHFNRRAGGTARTSEIASYSSVVHGPASHLLFPSPHHSSLHSPLLAEPHSLVHRLPEVVVSGLACRSSVAGHCVGVFCISDLLFYLISILHVVGSLEKPMGTAIADSRDITVILPATKRRPHWRPQRGNLSCRN